MKDLLNADDIIDILSGLAEQSVKTAYWTLVAFVPVAIAINTLKPITGLPEFSLGQSLALCFLVKVIHLTFEPKKL